MKESFFRQYTMHCLLFIFLFTSCATPPPPPDVEVSAEAPKADKAEAAKAFGKVPPYFIENRGQLDSQVKYYVKGPRGTVYLTAKEAVFDFVREKDLSPKVPDEEPGRAEREKERIYDRLVFRMKFKDPNPEPEIAGREELPGKVNYLIGPKEHWTANIPTFREVSYREIWKGIDLSFSLEGATLAYTFHVKPGANPRKIAFTYEGIEGLEIKPEGNLVVKTRFGGFVEKAPSAYQENGGEPAAVGVKFKLLEEETVTFDIAPYKPRQHLWIDPSSPF